MHHEDPSRGVARWLMVPRSSACRRADAMGSACVEMMLLLSSLMNVLDKSENLYSVTQVK